MAHGKLRTEKNCLNCNAQVSGRFCSVCGQENIDPKETFWDLVSHFFYDLFHYDGKVLSTLKTLVFKPGLLTHEYVRGRRASYLHPVRMYIFISAISFLLVFAFTKPEAEKVNDNFKAGVLHSKDSLLMQLSDTKDTAKQKEINRQIQIQNEILHIYNVSGVIMDSTDIKHPDTSSKITTGFVGDSLPYTIAEYDSLQKNLPVSEKDGWIERSFKRKLIAINIKYKGKEKEFIENFKEKFLHSLPTMMFISLPVAAMIFLLVYIRRKQFTYVQHGVFSLHIYSAVFVFILILYALGFLNNYLHWKLISIIITAGIIFIFYYVYKAMRNFYEQRRWKTFFKYFIFLFSYSFVLILLMIIFLLTSLIQV